MGNDAVRTPAPDAVSALRERLTGHLIEAGDDAYDDTRSVWNGTVDRRPRLIARCAGTADVQAAVLFAREHELPLAVRGGGHNVAGSAVCDGGLVVDLSEMREVLVDAGSRTVSAAEARPSGMSTRRRRPWDSPYPWVSSVRPASPGSPWEGGSAGFAESTA